MKGFILGAVVGSLATYVAMAAAMDELMEKIEAMGNPK